MEYSTSFLKSSRIARKSARYLWLITAAAACAFTLIVELTGVLFPTENSLIDLRFRKFPRPHEADTNIVLVVIDQKSLDFFEDSKIGWPFPREFYAEALRFLRTAGAKAVLFDIDFSSSEIDRIDVSAEASERALASEIASAGNVVLIAPVSDDAYPLRSGDIDHKYFARGFVPHDNRNFRYAAAPLPAFQKHARAVAFSNVFPDADGIIRRTPRYLRYKGGALPDPAAALYATVKNTALSEAHTALPYNDLTGGWYFINWYGKGGPDETFRSYSFHSVVVSGFKARSGRAPDIPSWAFRDKIVIIGGTATGLNDYRPVPVGYHQDFPGMEIHATILSNYLQVDFVRESPAWLSAVLALGFAGVIAFFFFFSTRIVYTLGAAVGMIALYVLIVFFSFYSGRFLLPVMTPLFAATTSLLFAVAVNYASEGKRRRQIKRLFGRYLNETVVDKLAENPDGIEFGGEEATATVFFSDIKDFTKISEGIDAAKLVKLLNRYFTICADCILKHNGMLDKYIGDSVMALFGAPVPVQNHALAACRAALDIQVRLREFNAELRREGIHEFHTRIGINTGKMIIGNIGTESHLDYTAIGDPVNLASRLEGANKEFNTRILISDTTMSLLDASIVVRELDNIKVKGRERPVGVFEVFCTRETLKEEEKNMLGMFSEGLALYRSRQWDEAIAVFEKLTRQFPADSPSQVYLYRCVKLKLNPPGPAWNGVFEMTTK